MSGQWRRQLLTAGLAAAAAAGGCAGNGRSALDPAGVQAGRISGQWWFFLGTAVVVYVIVMAVLLAAILRRRGRAGEGARAADDAPIIAPDPARDRRITRTIVGGIAVTTVILFVFLVADFVTGRALSATPADPLKIKVVGHQWWWEVQYTHIPWEPGGGYPWGIVNTANEIHIPVGQPVLVELDSRDVIHSFWVPRLNGKKDLIPGQPTSTWIQADQPGTFMGQCAEYCGLQHANMMIWVVAEPREQFEQWLASQRQAAGEAAARQARGRAVFLGTSCALCHTVQGTPANGRAGPDLSHVASRQRIAAGALENTRGSLGGWIADPQRIKPGAKMPPNPLPPDDLKALLDWLETLK
jgi:cytochrome c oxidase subunit 2